MNPKNTCSSVSPLLVVIGIALSWAVESAWAWGENLKTESRMPYHHVIPLRDAEANLMIPPPPLDEQGKPQEVRGRPYSTAQTCGRCHEYDFISRGWHFNAAKDNVKPGRPGEPWILTDLETRTQIPLSYRGWTGTFKPGELGLTGFDFIREFARHFPGGGVGDPAKGKIDLQDSKMRRFVVTGPLEVDCLICHNRDGGYDHEARLQALLGENFKWAPAIAAGLGVYASPRTAKIFADRWSTNQPAPTNIPAMKYDRSKFDLENNVTFEVTRKASSACYYCHTSASHLGDARWHSDEDVHLRAGMKCTDCHRNGVDHNVVRGYEGEIRDRTVTADMIDLRVKMVRRADAKISEAEAKQMAERQLGAELSSIETLTCRGCHLGSESGNQSSVRVAGRLGAPRPAHKGLPPVHFEKLACTACHSGPFPSDAVQIVHTSLAHKLGLQAPTRGENTAPIIVQPVFLHGHDGKIAPHKAVWPSYWGRLKEGKVNPILPDEIAKCAQGKLPKQPADDVPRDPYNSTPLADPEIQRVLTSLAADAAKGEAIYIAAGKIYRLSGTNLTSGEHAAAQAYTWAVAHDVRPAAQSLGARGCVDCHASDSPINFSTVTARGPVDPRNGVTQEMVALRGDDRTVASFFAFTFNFRPTLKIVCFGAALVVLGVLLARVFAGLTATSNKPPSQEKK